MLNYKGSRPLLGVVVMGIALAAWIPHGNTASAQQSDAEGDALPPIVVKNFRSAHFGMSEKEVRAAISRDFNREGEQIEEQNDPVYRTLTLVIRTNDVIPDSGPCEISYVFGYKTRKLIQVNLLWTMEDGELSADQIRNIGLLLREYFLGRGYDPDKVSLGGQLQTGATIVFRGFDDEDRMVLLLIERRRSSSGTQEGEEPSLISSLRLSYVEDVDSPDIFQLEEGSF